MKIIGIRDTQDLLQIANYETLADQLLIDAKPPRPRLIGGIDILPGGVDTRPGIKGEARRAAPSLGWAHLQPCAKLRGCKVPPP